MLNNCTFLERLGLRIPMSGWDHVQTQMCMIQITMIPFNSFLIKKRIDKKKVYDTNHYDSF